MFVFVSRLLYIYVHNAQAHRMTELPRFHRSLTLTFTHLYAEGREKCDLMATEYKTMSYISPLQGILILPHSLASIVSPESDLLQGEL